jgi:hypothetical protein
VKFSAILVAAAALAGLAAAAVPARAEPALADGICPAVGLETSGCELFISFNIDGSIVTSVGSSSGSYDSAGDTLIGIINNTANPISSFNISSNGDIFGFTSNGIDNFEGDGVTKTGDNPDTTGFGGPDIYFTAITGDASDEPEAGTVNIGNGGLPVGGADYFALVGNVLSGASQFNAAPTLNPYEPDPLLPEPGTLSILGVGLLASGMARRLRRKA